MKLAELLKESSSDNLKGDYLSTFLQADEFASFPEAWRSFILKDLGGKPSANDWMLGPNVRRIYVSNYSLTIILKDDSRIVIVPSANELYVSCFYGKPIFRSIAFNAMERLTRDHELLVQVGGVTMNFRSVDWNSYFADVRNNNSLSVGFNPEETVELTDEIRASRFCACLGVRASPSLKSKDALNFVISKIEA